MCSCGSEYISLLQQDLSFDSANPTTEVCLNHKATICIFDLQGSTFDLEGCIAYGPWGGSEGNNWVYLPKGFIQKMKITVRHDAAVDSISFQTNCSNGETQSSSNFGMGGRIVNHISIDDANEYLISISGTYGGTVGFSRFHGRASSYLNAIGVYVMPKSGPNSKFEGKNIPEELCSSLSMMTISRDAGPWGAAGGKSWDDGVFSMIKQIRVHVGVLNVIYALQFEYQKRNGDSVLSQMHGGTDGSKIELVNLDDKNEYLTGISGFYGPVKGYDGLEAIASISFHTNKRTHGPYGDEKGAGYVHFSSTPFAGKIVGLHGRSNGFLSAIGVHVEYF
ncbi:hypothetical protein SSX86_007800 [Deinandra increscens subsp. villosa]|uniref:Jacalin-type lectin domain-containing protein n=1 Tax=Deinandra increscens subsp. villosa TaxID=3103831 RepID=A0AAP0DFC7_9ASTR